MNNMNIEKKKYTFLFKRPELLNNEDKYLMNIAHILLCILITNRSSQYDSDIDNDNRIIINTYSYLVHKCKLDMNSLDKSIIIFILHNTMYKLGNFPLFNVYPDIDEYIDDLYTDESDSVWDINKKEIKYCIIEYTQKLISCVQKLTIIITLHYYYDNCGKSSDKKIRPLNIIDKDTYNSYPILDIINDDLLKYMLMKIGYAGSHLLPEL